MIARLVYLKEAEELDLSLFDRSTSRYFTADADADIDAHDNLEEWRAVQAEGHPSIQEAAEAYGEACLDGSFESGVMMLNSLDSQACEVACIQARTLYFECDPGGDYAVELDMFGVMDSFTVSSAQQTSREVPLGTRVLLRAEPYYDEGYYFASWSTRGTDHGHTPSTVAHESRYPQERFLVVTDTRVRAAIDREEMVVATALNTTGSPGPDVHFAGLINGRYVYYGAPRSFVTVRVAGDSSAGCTPDYFLAGGYPQSPIPNHNRGGVQRFQNGVYASGQCFLDATPPPPPLYSFHFIFGRVTTMGGYLSFGQGPYAVWSGSAGWAEYLTQYTGTPTPVVRARANPWPGWRVKELHGVEDVTTLTWKSQATDPNGSMPPGSVTVTFEPDPAPRLSVQSGFRGVLGGELPYCVRRNPGAVAVHPAKRYYEPGDIVTLTAVSNGCLSFCSWEGEAELVGGGNITEATSSTVQIVMNENSFAQALFVAPGSNELRIKAKAYVYKNGQRQFLREKTFEGRTPYTIRLEKHPPGYYLPIYFNEVSDGFEIDDIDVELEVQGCGENLEDGEWELVRGLTGALTETEGPATILRNPTRGGLYKITYTLPNDPPETPPSDVNIFLPLSGAEVRYQVALDLQRAEAFADLVKVTSMPYGGPNHPFNLVRWFWGQGAGDYLGRPDVLLLDNDVYISDFDRRTPWYYNQVNTTLGTGPVCTWFGVPIRIAKLSNFLLGYTISELDCFTIVRYSAPIAGTWDDESARASYWAGISVGDGDMSYENAVMQFLEEQYPGFEERVKKLWPNYTTVENHVLREDPLADQYDFYFSSPGFLEMWW